MDNFNIITEIHNTLYRKTFPDWEIPSRTIKDHELVLISSGKGTVIIEGKIITARKGMLFHFAPGVVHSLTTDEEDMMSFYAVHFDLYTCQPGQLPEFSPLPIDEVCTPTGFYILKNLFKSINSYSKNKLYGYELICNSLLGQLIFEILNSTRNSEINYSSLKKAEAIIDYIHQNISKKITLDELAEIFSLNSSYISQLFKNATGYNIIEFINKQKTDKAKELIIEGRYKIKDISALLGFDDPYYFSRVFKKTEGISPVGYYNRYINTDNENIT